MFFWHSAHSALRNAWDLLNRSSSTYVRFLSTSVQRAQGQEGCPAGARWPKMTDPLGRSSPGEINELLIWQQPHPLVFAEYEFRAPRSAPDARATLEKWRDVVRATADGVAIFAKQNERTGFFDLGPLIYVVSEDTSPNVAHNPAIEPPTSGSGWTTRALGWRGLQERFRRRGGRCADGLYAVYEGIPTDFWDTPTHTNFNDHSALVGLYGWLSQTANVSVDLAKATAEKVWTHWNITHCRG